jgi:hypothetical protein
MPFAIRIWLRNQPVMHPIAGAAIFHDACVSQDGEVAGHVGLRQPERLLQVANAKLPLRQESDDPQSRVIAERSEETRNGSDLDRRGRHNDIRIFEFSDERKPARDSLAGHHLASRRHDPAKLAARVGERAAHFGGGEVVERGSSGAIGAA